MPYVTIVFDPKKIPQKIVDKFKPWLQKEVAFAFGMDEMRVDPSSTEVDIATSKDEIFVTQQKVHPTDVNASPFEVYIQAGKPKGRDGDKLVQFLGVGIADTGWIPKQYLGDGQSCIFLVFHEHNGFAFLPRLDN